MSKKRKKNGSPRSRNALAKALASRLYRPRVVQDHRSKHQKLQHEEEVRRGEDE